MSAITSNTKGYTLVELLVVVSIIAVISALVVMRMLPVAAGSGDSRVALLDREWETIACRFNQNIVQNATEYHAVMHGRYPGTPADLFPQFLNRIPRCPVHDVDYHYDRHHLVVCPAHP